MNDSLRVVSQSTMGVLGDLPKHVSKCRAVSKCNSSHASRMLAISTQLLHTFHRSQYTVLTELEAAIIDIQATGRFGGLIRSSRFLALAESTQSRSTGSSKLDDTFDAIKAGVRPTWMIACEYLSDVSIAFKIGLRDVSDMCTSATSLTVLTHLLTKYHQIVQMSKCLL